MLPGISGVQLATLHARGLKTRASLVRRLNKYGASDPVIQGLPMPARADLIYSPVAQIPLATAASIGEELRRSLKIRGGPYIGPRRIWVVGSVRRGKDRTKDLDILVVLPGAPGKKSHLENIVSTTPRIAILHSYASGERRRSFIVRHRRRNYRVDMFLAYDSELPYALYHHTGSRRYNIRIRAHAKSQGWKLNQYGLFDASTGRRVHGSSGIKTEADLANFIGVTPREPHARDR
jgi:DNA polymerase (family X)